MFEAKPILQDGNKLLRKKSKKVKKPYSQEDRDLAKYLHDYLAFTQKPENIEEGNIRTAVGLAAPQLGVLKRICAIRIEYFNDENDKEKVTSVTSFAFINPKIISYAQRKAYIIAGEGCLSITEEHEGYVPRAAFVTVQGYDALTEQELTVKLRGYEAIVIQHELDHLEGILFYDHIDKEDPFKKIPGALEI